MPDLIDLPPPKDIIMDICGICGFGVYKHEIAAEITNGTFIDYTARGKPRAIGFVLCDECRVELVKNLSNPNAIEEATLKRAALTLMDTEDVNKKEGGNGLQA